MKKIALFAFCIFFVLSIRPADAANTFCDCQNRTGDCQILCSGYQDSDKICECEVGQSFTAIDQTVCDTQCAAQAAAAASANLPKVNSIFCDCNTQISQTNDQCKTQCPNYNNQKICMCAIGAKPTTMNADATAAVCQTDCQTAAAGQTETSPPAETSVEAGQPAPATSPAIKPKLYVPIPDLHFSDVVLATTGGGAASLPWISEYVIAVYKYAMGIGSILGIIMIMIAGVLYLTSAGNPQRVGQAKDYIVGSVIGLTVLFSSYLILNFINPQLTKLGSLQFQTVSLEQLEIEFQDAEAVGREDVNAGDYAPIPGAAPSAPAPRPSGEVLPVVALDPDNCKPSKPSGIGNASLLSKYQEMNCLSLGQRSLANITRVYIHEGSTAEKNVKSWINKYKKEGKTISSHYTINRDGTIYQMLGEEKVAAHVPCRKVFNERTGKKDKCDPNGIPNKNSIGIDLEVNVRTAYYWSKINTCLGLVKDKKIKGVENTKEAAIEFCTPTYTQAQYDSLKKLLQSIAGRTGYSYDISHTFAHCEWGGHTDPRNFDWSKLGQSTETHQDRNPSYCKYFPIYEERVKELADKLFQ
ncbi:MAG TPA: N-acetylmuramoyl-L-alanine amidase [Candidatus Bipolaricaulota bacterium]|nr:N-acetylmuramoyl-L-alanine amidase [Candidatus Bipolaricaulota bacterium]